MLNRRTFAAALPAMSASFPGWVQAQTYPAGTAKIIVPYAPGAATDALARLMAHVLEQALGTRFIVDNRPGGGTQIGTKAIATSAPDGLSLGFVDTAFVINPALVGSALPYDTVKDFVPLSLMASAPFVLLVHGSVPAKSVRELIALARSRSGGLAYGSAGIGSAPHLAGEQLRVASGADLQHIPYRGGSTVLNDLVAGHVQFAFTTVPTMIEHIRANSVRALAVTGSTRAAQLPDVPTMSEAGFPSVDAAPLFGLVAPAALPTPLAERISQIAAAEVKSGALNTKLLDLGFTPIGSSSAEFRNRIGSEIAKWSGVIKAGGIKPNS